MTSILIASHGHFASGLQSSLEILTGMGDQVTVIDAYVDDHDYTPEIESFVSSAPRPAVIFTDLQGGSVNQKVVLTVAQQPDIYIISQMNLAIILAVLLDDETVTAARLDELIAESQVARVELPVASAGDDQEFFE